MYHQSLTAQRGFALPPKVNDVRPVQKDWPHAPVHRLTEHGIHIITASTLHKQPLLNTDAKLEQFEDMLLSTARKHGWQLEAWAVLMNHYHFVARGAPDSSPMRDFLREIHSLSARELNRIDVTPGRNVWHNFWDTQLTFQHAYLARLNYVHQNPVEHGLVAVADQYRWCSAAWFERIASPAQIKLIYGFRLTR